MTDELTSNLYQVVKQFFALPEKVKLKYEIPGIAGQRRYTGKGKEHAKGRSTIHRVVNPPREKMNTSRYSIPFFMHPRSDMNLSCLENCIDTAHPKAYINITAGEFLIERLRQIGLQK